MNFALGDSRRAMRPGCSAGGDLDVAGTKGGVDSEGRGADDVF